MMWGFPKIVVPQKGWFTMENPIKMDDLGGIRKTHYFRKHPCHDSYLPMNICEFPSRLHLCPWRDAGNGGFGYIMTYEWVRRVGSKNIIKCFYCETELVMIVVGILAANSNGQCDGYSNFCWLLFVKCSETTLELLCFNTSSCSNF